jgi:phosphate-selective porin OprO/OprP
MKRWPALFCVVFGLTATAWSDTRTPAEETVQRDEEEEEEEADSVYWDDGLWFNKPRFRMKVGGDAMLDAAAFLAGEPGDELDNGIEGRRARVYASLNFLERWGAMFQWDFVASDPPDLKDAFLRFEPSRIPITLRGGRFTSTFGLENDGSADDTVFMEQGLTSTFVPPQETGVLVHSQSSRRRWDIGFTSGATSIQCLVCDVAGLVGRYSTAFELGEKRILHLGSDLSRRWTHEGARFRSRPESYIAPFFVDTELMEDAERVDTALFEVAFLDGPFSMQSEFGFARTKLPDGADPTFTAVYIFASYALTGEARRYSESKGTIGRIQAHRELGDGHGAFELAVRMSHIDLNDADIVGGELTDFSVAFNWYPTHPTRVMFNIVRAHRKQVAPAWVFQLRFQLAF